MKVSSRHLFTFTCAAALVAAVFAANTRSLHAQMTMPAATANAVGDQRQVYTVQLNSLNAGAGLMGTAVNGTANIIVDGDRIGVTLNAYGLDAGVMHMAHIHKGPRCPTAADDTNYDGYVDVLEGVPAYGAILVNLGNDLNSFASSLSFAPTADQYGQETYLASGSVSSLLKDLHRVAPNPATGVGVLATNEPFDIANAHIVIHGIDPSVSLPSTVQTITGATSNQSLPVACGAITQVSGPVQTLPPTPAPSPSVVASATNSMNH